ncbi:MAG TPA: ATP-binding protein [Vicinamibacterales bacterium]|jgi:signal transduction histidine kinase/ActR/RegA family two-component response regulator|nr:ATP-binding protein [Vicinamibacterales bacterium]
MTGPHIAPPNTLDALRERVLRASIALLAVGMPIASVLVIMQGAQEQQLNLRTFALSGAMVCFPLLWIVTPRLKFRTAAGIFVGLLVLSALILASRGVLTVGYAAIDLLAILSATLFFGRGGAVFGMCAVIGAHLTGWAIVSFEVGPPPAINLIDPRLPAVWIRHVVVLGVLGTLIAVTELYVVEQLAREVQVHRRLADLEMEQRLALERAERERAHEREERERAQHALDQARRLEALARMSGGIAHDFNNALTVIIGTADVAKLSLSSPDDVAAYLDEIVQAAKRAGQLTTQLLTLGRAQIGAREPVEMTDFLGRLQSALRRVLPDDVVLHVDAPTEPVTARADLAGLERALYNLVLNARDAMPGGSGTITLSCHRETVTGHESLADGAYAVLRVADTGHGMDAPTLERIFDPFFTTKSERGGTGLGLATVNAFAKDSGGHVEVTSTVGGGTTFTLWLPEHTGAPAATPTAAPAAPAPPPAANRVRVLVVEDRGDVRANMVRTLTAHGFDVEEAADGAGALALLGQPRDYTLMCIDGVMPGLGTADVLARASELAPSMGVLVCSGYLREDLLRRGVEAGRYAFLAKPFTAEQLLAGVDSVIRATVTPRTTG